MTLGELRAQIRIAHLEQLRVIVFRKNPQLRLAGPIDAIGIVQSDTIRVIDIECEPHIGERLEIVVAIALAVVDVLRRQVVVDVSLFHS